MKNMCNVIGDILPLYAEGLTSADTNEFVEEHIAECENCKNAVESLKKQVNVDKSIEAVPLKNIKGQIRKRKLRLAALSALILLIAAFTVFNLLTARRYIAYDSDIVNITVKEEANENINQPILLLTFDEQVTGYNIDESLSEDGRTKVYTVSAWYTPLDRMLKKGTQHAVIDQSESGGFLVFYNQNNGDADALIYSNVLYDLDGGRISLPRMVLSYYFVLAFIAVILSGILVFVLRKKPRAKEVMKKLMFVPLSYLIGHLCIKQFTFISYNAQTDFIKILLIAVPVYFVLIIINRLIKDAGGKN